MSKAEFDLCVIGGGINGAGIARDAAGRGLSVCLVEAGDLASSTSSASTKLIHGGLRYLEYFELRLVRESLKEREVLLRAAPHIVRPLNFVLPHDEAQRPAWMIKAGLFLYDHLAGRQILQKSQQIDLRGNDFGKPLKDQYAEGFVYADCQTDDARLVVLNAMDAAERGANVLTRTACTGLKAGDGWWSVNLRDMISGEEYGIQARAVVNAAGPWVRGVLEASGLASDNVPRVRLVKGSHIVVPRQYEGEQAYILQQVDKRMLFAIPYEREFTLIGTTEEEYEGDPVAAQISQEEMNYLLGSYNKFFQKQISAQDIVWAYSGVRPLIDDGRDSATSVTRDYLIHHHADQNVPLLSVFGGKLTTYRRLAEETVNILSKLRGKRSCGWTAGHALPGGDIVDNNFENFLSALAQQYPWLSDDLRRRYARAYGTRIHHMLSGAESLDDLGRDLGEGVYEAEIHYLVHYEWAQSAEDVLWRRSKLALHAGPETVKEIEWMVSSILKERDKDEQAHVAGH